MIDVFAVVGLVGLLVVFVVGVVLGVAAADARINTLIDRFNTQYPPVATTPIPRHADNAPITPFGPPSASPGGGPNTSFRRDCPRAYGGKVSSIGRPSQLFTRFRRF